MKFECTQTPIYTITLTEHEAKALAELLSRSGRIWEDSPSKACDICEDVSSRLYSLMYDLDVCGL